MTLHQRLRANDIPMPTGVLMATVWNELHDYLHLALDAIGARPENFTEDFPRNAVMHQRLAIRITHGALERMIVPARELDRLDGCHLPRGGA